MKTIHKIIVLLSITMVIACNDDFLDTVPKDEISAENFFNTASDLQLYIDGLHSVSGYGTFLGDQATDDVATTGAVELKNIMIGSPSAENINSGWNWGRLRQINFFLENFDKAEIDDATKKHYEGIAKYHRANFYYGMVRRYSDVPYYSKTLGASDEDLYKARDPRAMVVDSVFKDIQFATQYINEEAAGTEKVSKWAALHVLARMALHEGTYRKYHPELGLESTANTFLQMSSDAAKQLMDSGNFNVYTTGSPNSDYGSLFNSDNQTSNPEAILVNIYDVEKEKTSGNNTVFGDYEQSATKSLLNNYLMQDGTRFSDQPGSDTFTYVQEFQNRDPRMSQTFVYPGWVRRNEPAPYIPEFNRNFTGYFQTKGYNNSNTNENQGNDLIVMRYAETLLIYAEAKAELGTLMQADLDNSINKLRARVGLPNLDMVGANADIDPIFESDYPNVSGVNKGVIYEIRRERRAELALESFRLYDLQRWYAGKVLERNPIGMYFPGLGKYDMTGDGVEDISIIGSSDDIPSPKEQNALGVDLIYYKAGVFGDAAASIYLSNGTSGNMVANIDVRTFEEPKYYYRPIPAHQVALNPQLSQIMGW
ncbi:RagB/SusD family nutrient uptake outer membrane protein [Flavivirga spongiicola]|uniref:RagB/SusD family nutrient uptake outer membrane protein n=1 Tax=Flavivirga spongiicola TaxID=421621 RepID=A0ABU7XS07_9FLAO|nr:RagB/SusD family nutrient uptake outer membrane protein [Flavivirga sp. MEBiC05379]MDO5978238.1 RagB/SusD family nutrient uptake outer membrane protein [Flavivirga sp. MEBiC05379]